MFKQLCQQHFPIIVFLGKAILQVCIKFTGKHPCRELISIKLLYNFIEITLLHGCSPTNWAAFGQPIFTSKTYDYNSAENNLLKL